MNSWFIMSPVAIAGVIAIILKIVKVVCFRKKEVKQLESIELIRTKQASYEKFEAISNQSLGGNGPKRKEKSFLDFVIVHIDAQLQNEELQNVENRIIRMSYGTKNGK